jgi:hypothetical protein
MRRLFGADSLRSNNRFFGGPPPLCGGSYGFHPLRMMTP